MTFAATTTRERFHRWVNAREYPASLAEAGDFIRRALARADVGGMADRPESLLACPPPALAEPVALRAEALLFHAPLGLLEGAWLQDAALAGNGHRAVVTDLFAAHLALLGTDEAAAPASYYRGALAQAGVALPGVGAWQFASDSRIGDAALDFSGLQLALGLHGYALLPEVIGYTLAYARAAAPWRLCAMPQVRRAEIIRVMDEQARRALRVLLDESHETQSSFYRVRRGMALYAQAEAGYTMALDAFDARDVGLDERMGELFKRKARHARGYHGRVELGGRCLDAWFADEPFDAPRFLEQLASSPWLAGAEGERPFDRLTGFGGPMFGVFDASELALIAEWRKRADGCAGVAATTRGLEKEALIEPTPAGRDPSALPNPNGIPEPSLTVGWNERSEFQLSELNRSCLKPSPNPRTLFHRLVGGENSAELSAQARRVVERVLRRAGRRGLFSEYSPQALTDWTEHRYAEQIARHRPFDGRPKLTRQEYVWGIRQFAPAILADGGWLQHQGEAAWQGDRVRRLLFRIYADELGAGRVERNHPNVYRALLESVGVDLPPFDSVAFASHEGFLDSAFDLPVYLLAISRFPSRYLPEILGLNLAIELSGLGAQYLRLAEELRHWGIDPLIVTLHQSIDTLAGGHTALAVEAIQLHLDEVGAAAGEKAIAEHWRRIGRGYRSLASATRRFKWALVLAYCRRFLPGRLARYWAENRVKVL